MTREFTDAKKVDKSKAAYLLKTNNLLLLLVWHGSTSGLLPLSRHHHERWDGSGYPDNLRGTEIPLLARVLQVVDIYDALTNPRPYKQAYSSAHALAILQEETDRGWRDKEIVSLFIRTHQRMLAAIADAQVGGYGLTGIGDSLRNLQALAMY